MVCRRLLLASLLATATAAGLAGSASQVRAEPRSLTLASTTSTEQAGLFGHLIPLFRADTGIDVRVVAVGTGQALAIAARGDADAVLVHDRVGEDRFVAEDHGLDRRDVMFNDFVLLGPKGDPAGIRGQQSAPEALKRIAAVAASFASQGDDSGTPPHRAAALEGGRHRGQRARFILPRTRPGHGADAQCGGSHGQQSSLPGFLSHS
jgi:tungstate transport system substrate-binding protein